VNAFCDDDSTMCSPSSHRSRKLSPVARICTVICDVVSNIFRNHWWLNAGSSLIGPRLLIHFGFGKSSPAGSPARGPVMSDQRTPIAGVQLPESSHAPCPYRLM
jgi:hypothetical protein